MNPASSNLPIRDRQHPSVPAYLIRAGSAMLGENLVGFRMFSLVTGVATIFLVYRLGLEWAGRATALWAAGLLTFNEYHDGVSVMAVEKSYYILFAMASVYLFARHLRDPKPPLLCLAGFCLGLAYLSKETAILLLPVFLVAVILVRPRLLRTKEIYVAFLVFLVVISPDVLWNLQHPTTQGSEANYSDHLSRFGGIGITKQPFIFYLRDASFAVYNRLGRDLGESDRPYPSMNSISGAIILGLVVLATVRRPIRNGTTTLLLVMFWLIFCVFVLIRPGNPAPALRLYRPSGLI